MSASEQTPLHSFGGAPTAGTFAPAEGLSSSEAAKRLAADGPNKLKTAEEEPFLSILLTQMKSVIFLLTLTAAGVSHGLGERVKPYMLVSLVVSVCLAKAIGEYSGQNASEALTSMTASQALVLRDGEEVLVDQENLVVGDVVKVRAGDVVPADMVVLDSLDLQANEALLTGEPYEQRKTVEPIGKNSTFPSNMLYKGTGLVGGKGKGEVVATGMQTQVGLIAKRLKSEEQPLSPLQESINMIGTLIGFGCILVVTVATGIAYLTKFNDPAHPCMDDSSDCLMLSSLLRGLTMAVAIIPHGLPFVVTVMFRVGAREMKERNALVMRESVVDYIGATTVICTDKTGTLTEGKMTAKRLYGLCANDDPTSHESSLDFYPLRGLNPNGGLFSSKDLTRQAMAQMDKMFDIQAQRQVFAEEELPDYGDFSVPREGVDAQLARAHVACGFLTCYGASICKGDVPGKWETQGNMTETAVKVAAAKCGYWDHEGPGAKLLSALPRDEELEVPFTSTRKMMATVHQLSGDSSLDCLQLAKDSTHLVILKGAPDKIIGRLQQVPLRQHESIVVPGRAISETERKLLETWNTDLARDALRSLLVSVCALSAGAVERMRSQPDADTRLAYLLEQPGLCFLSLWGIYDPPRAMVRGSVEECYDAGIRIVMITGDQHPTAVAVAKQVGILTDDHEASWNASECLELQLEKPIVTDTNRLSKRASQLITSADLVTQQRRSSVNLGKMVMSRGSSRRLSVHDARGRYDRHEPTYKADEDLAVLTSRMNVWARAQPTDKVAIVSSLSQQQHITVMTGDGVNDAPALKHADTGVAMGISGSEVTKNASSLVLMDDDFSTIVAAVREGRRIYRNTQKYLLYNFCVKEGELCCVLFAIILRMPLPIQGLQQLVNLIATHIAPPLVLAYEEPEPYLMKLPPRKTKYDFIVTPAMMIRRWIPFCLVLALGVLTTLRSALWLHTGFVTSEALIGTSVMGQVERGLAACEFAGAFDGEGRFVIDPAPFHCKCHDHWDDMEVDQWGRAQLSNQEVHSKFDPWTGYSGDLYNKDASDWSEGTDKLLKPCPDANGILHWCWKDNAFGGKGRPLLPAQQNCAEYGTKLSGTMGYVSIQIGEILALMNFRRDDSIFKMPTSSSRLYAFVLIANVLALGVFLYEPTVAATLNFAPLSAKRLGVALIAPIILVLCNEVAKHSYMAHFKAEQAALKDSTPAHKADLDSHGNFDDLSEAV